MDRLLANMLLYSYFIVIGIVSVSSAIYLPVLGIIFSIGLTAYFFDFNKRVFGKFFVSLNTFLRKNKMVTGDHRLLFFVFSISLIVNLVMIVVRLVR